MENDEDRKKVSLYSTGGWVEDLPDLLIGRGSHGCGHYVDNENRVVSSFNHSLNL